MKKRVAVIGGGFSGLGSIKCLREEGLDVVCYEKTDIAGGTWSYREHAEEGVPSIMPSTVINHSKEMGALSDYVPPKEFPNYMRHFEMLRLFNDIGKKFHCFEHIVYNSEVMKVMKSEDYDDTGKWVLTVRNTLTQQVAGEVFDGVMVCVGHITYPRMVEFPGMDKFEGKIMHTHSLKRVDSFWNKKVVVVGIGCSGLDAAVELSNVASQVYLSSRNGAWVLPRIGPYGLPFDYAVIRRFVNLFQSWFGFKFASWLLEYTQINKRFNHTLYNLRPDYPILAKDPSINDVLPSKLLSGSVVLRKNVKCFTEKGVIFEGETKVTEADAVIMATGYSWKFPFLEEGVLRKEGDKVHLYKCVFPPHLKHPTLSMIGFILPFGAGFPLGEMQCRWAAHLLAGKGRLPSETVMEADIDKRYEENCKRYSPSNKMSFRVDFISYMDEVAVELGVKPNFLKMFFTDFKLFRALMFGPALPYQYRLEGPHNWNGARTAILTAYDRVRYPLSGEKKKKQNKKSAFTEGFLYKCIVTFVLMTFWLFQTETSLKCFILVLFMAYVMTWKGFYKKYLMSMLLLPFIVPWDGFLSSYLLTLFVPMFIAAISNS